MAVKLSYATRAKYMVTSYGIHSRRVNFVKSLLVTLSRTLRHTSRRNIETVAIVGHFIEWVILALTRCQYRRFPFWIVLSKRLLHAPPLSSQLSYSRISNTDVLNNLLLLWIPRLLKSRQTQKFNIIWNYSCTFENVSRVIILPLCNGQRVRQPSQESHTSLTIRR